MTAPARSSPTPADRLRQVTVTLAEIFCVGGTLVGVGAFGQRVAESSGGALAADATLIAPAGPAFSVWTPIYLGLFAYTIWQWMPSQASAPRQRRLGWLVAASMVLNAGWLLVTQAGWLAVSVLVIATLLAVLVAIVARLCATPPTRPQGWVEPVLTDGTFGAYLGWVTVAACANVTATLVATGLRPERRTAELAAAGVLTAAAVAGVVLARRLGGRLAVAATLVWGLAWIAAGRTAGEPASLVTAVAALAAATVIVTSTLSARRRRLQREPGPVPVGPPVPAR
jgi:hypothetical protein